MDFLKILIVGSGGFIGTIGRFLMVKFLDQKINSVFPYGTLSVNLIGSFLLGVIFAMIQRSSGNSTEQWRLFLATGFCGGFTTFSAFALENVILIENKMALSSVVYIALSLAAGIFAVMLGVWCTRFL